MKPKNSVPYWKLQGEEYWRFVFKILGYTALYAVFFMLMWQGACSCYEAVREQNRGTARRLPPRLKVSIGNQNQKPTGRKSGGRGSLPLLVSGARRGACPFFATHSVAAWSPT